MPQNSLEIAANRFKHGKPPRLILPGIFAFAPNRDTLGATAYFIVDKSGNILLDCPSWNESEREFILMQGGVKRLIISHRGGIGKQIRLIQEDLNCEVIIQENEAYLLPEIEVTTFAENLTFNSNLELIWTSGHSPGAACLYWQEAGGVLFSGRHLLPTTSGEILPLRSAKTFHWWRQLQSITKLRDRLSTDTLNYICPGANTGFLRGKGYVDRAYERLLALDLEVLKSASIWEGDITKIKRQAMIRNI
jgi:glyoxylase-like metal-dependent hydrolase (beta-lactamase superfamily II)